MLKFYLVVVLATLDFPLFTTGLNVQSISCFAIAVLLLQNCVILVFPAPLIHRLLGSYFALAHVFYRLHYFTASAS